MRSRSEGPAGGCCRTWGHEPAVVRSVLPLSMETQASLHSSPFITVGANRLLQNPGCPVQTHTVADLCGGSQAGSGAEDRCGRGCCPVPPPSFPCWDTQLPPTASPHLAPQEIQAFLFQDPSSELARGGELSHLPGLREHPPSWELPGMGFLLAYLSHVSRMSPRTQGLR